MAKVIFYPEKCLPHSETTRYFDGIALEPGQNFLTNQQLEKLKKHPDYQKYKTDGAIAVQPPDSAEIIPEPVKPVTIPWEKITNKPEVFPTSSDRITDISDTARTMLTIEKMTIDWQNVKNKPEVFSTSIEHITDISPLGQTLITAKDPSVVQSLVRMPTTISWQNITDKPTTFPTATNVSWQDIGNKPEIFPTSSDRITDGSDIGKKIFIAPDVNTIRSLIGIVDTAIKPKLAIVNHASSITVDASKVDSTLSTVRLTLIGNCNFTISNPTDGQTIEFEIIQDAIGGRNMTLSNIFNFGGLIGSFSLSSSPNKTDYFRVKYSAARQKWDVLLLSKGF